MKRIFCLITMLSALLAQSAGMRFSDYPAINATNLQSTDLLLIARPGAPGTNYKTSATGFATVAGLANYNTNVSLSIVTNFAWQIATNYNVITNATGMPTDVRGTNLYAGVASGINFWTNLNGLAAYYSNPPIAEITVPFWCIATNNGIPTTTNLIYYYNTNLDANGYPSGGWMRIASPSGTPSPGLKFLSTNTLTLNPFAHIYSPYEISTPLASNSTVARVEKWGSDTMGRVGFTPFASVIGTVQIVSNPPSTILVGPGWWTNDYDGAPTIPVISPGQKLVGSGQGVTLFGSPAATNTIFYASLYLSGSNVLRDVTVVNSLAATNYTGRAMTNLLVEDCTLGSFTSVDSIIGGISAGIWDATFNRVTFKSCWDCTMGVGTADYNDCNWILQGTNQAAMCVLSTTNGVRAIEIGVQSGARATNIIRGGMVDIQSIVPAEFIGALTTNCCVYLISTNINLTILGTRFNYPDKCVPFYSIDRGTNMAGLPINGFFYNNGVLTLATNGVFSIASIPISAVVGTASKLDTTNGFAVGLSMTNGTANALTLTNAILKKQAWIQGTNTDFTIYGYEDGVTTNAVLIVSGAGDVTVLGNLFASGLGTGTIIPAGQLTTGTIPNAARIAATNNVTASGIYCLYISAGGATTYFTNVFTGAINNTATNYLGILAGPTLYIGQHTNTGLFSSGIQSGRNLGMTNGFIYGYSGTTERGRLDLVGGRLSLGSSGGSADAFDIVVDTTTEAKYGGGLSATTPIIHRFAGTGTFSASVTTSNTITATNCYIHPIQTINTFTNYGFLWSNNPIILTYTNAVILMGSNTIGGDGRMFKVAPIGTHAVTLYSTNGGFIEYSTGVITTNSTWSGGGSFNFVSLGTNWLRLP